MLACVVHQPFVPDAFSSQPGKTSPPLRVSIVHLCWHLPKERERFACDVQLQSHGGMFGMKSIESQLEVVLADEPVGSLGARDEIALDAKQLGTIVADRLAAAKKVVHTHRTLDQHRQ